MIITQSQRCLIAIAVAVLAVALTAFFGDPLFATNDDVGLAMIGAGFGMAVRPEPHLVFSHYGYGLILNILSRAVGIRAHGFLSLFSVGFSLGLFTYTVSRRLDVLAVAILSVVGFIYLTALLEPQFTVTAGVLASAGLACFIFAVQSGDVSCRLQVPVYFALILSFLIRPASAIAAFVVFAPALGWMALKSSSDKRRHVWCFAASIIGLVVVLSVVDWATYYFSPDWQNIQEYNFFRALFNDLRRIRWSNNAEIFKSVGWSRNDFFMFNSWFTNHEIFSFRNISAIAVDQVGRSAFVNAKIITAWFFKIATEPQLIIVFLGQGALLLAFREARPIILLLFLGAASAVLISASTGRPPLDRVLLMIAAAGLLGSFAAVSAKDPVSQMPRIRTAVSVLLATVGIWFGLEVMKGHRERVEKAAVYREDIKAISPYLSGRVVSWGASLIWEWLVTPMHVFPPVEGATIPFISVFSPTPVMTETLKAVGIQDLGKTLCTESDIRLIAPKVYVARLEQFCKERYATLPNYVLVHTISPRTDIFVREIAKSSPR